MKRFSGTIKKTNGITGELTGPSRLKIHITPLSKAPHASVKIEKVCTAGCHSVPVFSAVIKRLYKLFNFIVAKSRLAHSYRAKVEAAKVYDVRAENEIPIKTSTTVGNTPTQAVKINQKERGALHSLRMAAYNLAAVHFFASILHSYRGKAEAAPGITLSYAEGVPQEGAAALEAADSAVFGSAPNDTLTEHSAAMITGEGTELSAEVEVLTEHSATAATAEAITTGAKTEDTTEHSCGVVYWIEPVLENGILKIRSVYSATKNGDILEVR